MYIYWMGMRSLTILSVILCSYLNHWVLAGATLIKFLWLLFAWAADLWARTATDYFLEPFSETFPQLISRTSRCSGRITLSQRWQMDNKRPDLRKQNGRRDFFPWKLLPRRLPRRPLVEMAANLNAYHRQLDGHKWCGAVQHVAKLV